MAAATTTGTCACAVAVATERRSVCAVTCPRPALLADPSTPLVAEVETALASGNGHADPAQVRPRLAEAAAASLDDISTALLDAALGATREMWVTTACSGCGKKQRVEVKIPDVRSRVAAIELLLREGLGRPPQAEEAASPRLPRTAGAVEKLSWSDMKLIYATQFAAEIAAVTENSDALLRERVAALDEEQRQLLREALVDAM